MKSTSGEYYGALDHVRAVAVLLVFVWHFFYGRSDAIVPFEGISNWGPLVLFHQGHIGVALFMTLSGYLFAKLLDGKAIVYRYFLWNRVLRLLPLLALVMLLNAVIAAASGHDIRAAYWYLLELPRGLVFPSWPNGGWSIAVELHFYLVLPLLLFLQKRWPYALWLLIGIAILLRLAYYSQNGEVQSMAYWTIMGRIDQFVLGIIAFRARSLVTGRHALLLGMSAAYVALYAVLNDKGGLWGSPSHSSTSSAWILTPTLDGLMFAAMIAWYDSSFVHARGRVSDAIAKVGQYSYSIYLLHFYLVFWAAHWIHGHLLDLSSFSVALPVALLVFLVMIPVGYLSMRFIEQPFLRLRRRYTVAEPESNRGAPARASSLELQP